MPAAEAVDDLPTVGSGGLSVPSVPGRLQEAYDVQKPVGKGGYAIVYKGIRREDGRVVAVKKVEIFEMTQKKRERCLQEVTLLQQLSHPYIIQMYDAFIDENMLIIIFEWAPAGDLKRLIKKTAEAGRTLDEATIWSSFSQIVDALRYMHQQRIMHRDIKPANVLVGANGALKIGDLGLGRQLSEQTMEAFSKVGTPYYVSPEVVRGAGYDWKSDVWSLGCLLYELAVLKSPFEMEGANLYDVFQKISKGDYQPLPANMFSAPLRNLVVRMLSVDPAQRPELDEVWSITQSVVQSQTKATGGRQDVHSVSEILVSRLLLLEADVTHKLAKQNGKRVDLAPPPTDALRELHPLSFAEPLRPGAVGGNGDMEQKRQLGIFVAVFAWLLRLAGRAEIAPTLESLLEFLPSPNGRLRRTVALVGGVAQSSGTTMSPQPPVGKRSGTSSVKRGASRADPATDGGSPPDAAGKSTSVLSPSVVPSCMNILKGAEAIKKAAQAVGLSTEFAPVNAIAIGHGRAVCSLLQDMMSTAAEKVHPAARRPRYRDEEAEALPDDEDGADGGLIDDDDGAVMDASHPLPPGVTASGAEGDSDEDEAFFSHLNGKGLSSQGAEPGCSNGSVGGGMGMRGGGRNNGLDNGRGSGPGRPKPDPSSASAPLVAVGGQAVDPVAWRAELDRLLPQLSRIVLPAEVASGAAAVGWGDWHGRWQHFKAGAAGLSKSSPEATAALVKTRSGLAEDLDRVSAAERRLNSGSEGRIVEYRTARQRLSELQSHVNKQEDVLASGNAVLVEITVRLHEVGAGMNERAGALDGGSQISGIQTALRRLRQEMGRMDTRIGVLQQQLLARQHKVQLGTRWDEDFEPES